MSRMAALDDTLSLHHTPCLYVCSFITSGGTGFEVFFTSHAETTRICNLVVATVSKKEVVTLSLTEFHFKANRWVTKTQMFCLVDLFPSSCFFLFPISLASIHHCSTVLVLCTMCLEGCGGSQRFRFSSTGK